MREWTDLDYAQAAIDMLPGSVEEIEEFLHAQRITSKWTPDGCPIQRWTAKWTGTSTSVGFETYATRDSWAFLPDHVKEYILVVDRKGF